MKRRSIGAQHKKPDLFYMQLNNIALIIFGNLALQAVILYSFLRCDVVQSLSQQCLFLFTQQSLAFFFTKTASWLLLICSSVLTRLHWSRKWSCSFFLLLLGAGNKLAIPIQHMVPGLPELFLTFFPFLLNLNNSMS